jgi:hypothetical protein
MFHFNGVTTEKSTLPYIMFLVLSAASFAIETNITKSTTIAANLLYVYRCNSISNKL